MRTATLALSALAAVSAFATSASPGPLAPHAGKTAMSIGSAALQFGRSLGSPTDGRLVGGTHLDETAYLRVMPADAAGDVRWGLEPLVGMVDRAARSVRRRYPGAVTSVGHLSREGGGDLDRHRSHESGRDADIAFFVHSTSGRQLLAEHFVAFRGDGTAPSWPGAFFDDAKNWALLAAMVNDPEAHVTHVFVSSPLRARLLAYAERTGVDAPERTRVAEVLQQPHGALPHDDHFHVRIACPAHMSGCVENPAPRLPQLARGRPYHRPAAVAPSRGPAPIQGKPPGAPVPLRDAPAVVMAPLDDVDG